MLHSCAAHFQDLSPIQAHPNFCHETPYYQLPNLKPEGEENTFLRKFSNATSAINSDLSQTLRTPPVSLGNIVERRDQAEGVVTVITPITQEKPVLIVATATQEADIQVNLQHENGHRTQGHELLFDSVKL